MNTPLNNLLERIGASLLRIRQQRNEKQYNVAHALNICEAVISRIETGQYRCLSIELLHRLAQHYGITVDELLAAA
jgi:transcriptional regulator with XRE-family HTH domain